MPKAFDSLDVFERSELESLEAYTTAATSAAT
jgi:hypothetical protein